MALQKCALNVNNKNKELQPHGTLEFPCESNRRVTDSISIEIPTDSKRLYSNQVSG